MRDKILYEMQKNFPLTKRPFADIANKLDISEDEVIDIIKKEKDNGIIRQTSAIFDTKRLGYKSSLVAFEVDKNGINKAVEILNSHPGISHNYERNHLFNIWFTLAVPSDSLLGLEKTVEILAKACEAKEFILLPTLKLFKIAVKLDTTGKAQKKEKVAKKRYKDIKLTDLHKKVIALAQEDISVVKEPFFDMINKLGIDYETFFGILSELKAGGYMRRFATILNHRKAGFNANAMVVWDIDENVAEEMGEKLASFSAVSHCYLRPKFPNWKYNIFSMVHGKTKEETDSIVKEMEKEIKFNENRYLYSSREFKKIRVKYYTDETYKWEEKMLENIEK